PPTEISTLSLHDALPISDPQTGRQSVSRTGRRARHLARDQIRVRGRRYAGCDAGMRLETFSYLPRLSAGQLTQQIRSILSRHLRSEEHTSELQSLTNLVC